MKTELLGVKAPQQNCTDQKCPFHGKISVKEEVFTGKVVKKDLNRSATIEWEKSSYLPKYERYEVRRKRLHAHNPACINAQAGDLVVVAKTRPLSKTKHHVIIQKTGKALEIKATDVGEERKSRASRKSASEPAGKGEPE